MSSDTYAIVFKGDILDGHDLPTVKLELAKLLKLKPDKIETLFSGQPVIIKKSTDKAEAARYGRALKRTGADVKLRPIRQTEPVMAAESAGESTTRETAQPDTEEQPRQNRSVRGKLSTLKTTAPVTTRLYGTFVLFAAGKWCSQNAILCSAGRA